VLVVQVAAVERAAQVLLQAESAGTLAAVVAPALLG
jgi:hypothetical protein